MRRTILLLSVSMLVMTSCGGDTEGNEGAGSATPTTSIRFAPCPPGTSTVAEALQVGKDYADGLAAGTADESVWALWAEDATLNLYISGGMSLGRVAIAEHLAAGEEAGFRFPERYTLSATDGAAVVEWYQTLEGRMADITLEVICVSDGMIEHVEVFGEAGEVATPVAAEPGPSDDAAAAEATVTAYFTALADTDAAAAAALYSPQVVFLDDVGEPGGVREANAWNERLLAVPSLVFEPRSIIAGEGWAVARWVFAGDTSTGESNAVFGATMFEVRDGKIVRQTLYYPFGASPFGG